MNNTLENLHGYVIEQWTQHWRLIDGSWYRDAVAITPAGQRRLVSFPDGGAL